MERPLQSDRAESGGGKFPRMPALLSLGNVQFGSQRGYFGGVERGPDARRLPSIKIFRRSAAYPPLAGAHAAAGVQLCLAPG